MAKTFKQSGRQALEGPTESNARHIRRVRRSKAAARASYNRMSAWYDLFARSERKFTLKGLEMLAPETGENILEVGFGTGEILARIAEAVGEQGQVFGIDISEGMCSRTRNKLEERGLNDRVNLTCEDAASLPYPDAGFDALFAGFTLELFDTPEIPDVLAEWRRVLQKDGRIVLVSLLKEERPAVRLYEALHERFPAALDCRPLFLQEELEEAGFHTEGFEKASMWGLLVGIALARPQ